MNKIAIFASGGGTNAEAIMNFFESSDTAKVAILLSNRRTAYALQRAENHGVPAVHFSKSTLYDNPQEIVEILNQYEVNFIVLAGFMCFVPDEITRGWAGRIINIHPALLPKFGGQGMYGDNVHKAVVAAGERESGITIHFVNENYDEGAIIFQAKCEVLPSDTAEDVAAKIHELEQTHFPKIIEQTILTVTKE